MPADGVDALVIFGATGDLAKLETFPALVGLVQRGVLDVPIVGVASPARTCAPTTGSSARRWTATGGCSPSRTLWRPPGGSWTRCSAT
jgi:hypothetical protein